ncbi:MAG: hypothetical protein AB1755_03085 [Candidatus Omnitrophota bacterium]
MFDFKDMGNMMKLANEAKVMQEKQERSAREHMDLLKKISGQLDEILKELRKDK